MLFLLLDLIKETIGLLEILGELAGEKTASLDLLQEIPAIFSEDLIKLFDFIISFKER